MTDSLRSGFIWYEHMTGDLDQAVAFYRDLVGWEFRDSGMPGPRYLLFGKDGKDVGGMISWQSVGGPGKLPQWMGHLFSPKVDAEVAAVVADGGRQVRPPQDIPSVGRFAVVSDPQGAEYLLFQPSSAMPPARLGPTAVGNIGWHELVTTDWQSAWTFYSAHYGWTRETALDMGPAGTYQVFSLDGTEAGGMMNRPAGDSSSPSWTFYVVVEEIQRAARLIVERGGQVTRGPHQVPGGGWILHGTDPQGGPLALTAAH